MYRLLIIDDEQITADSLANLFEDVDDLELDVYKTYSAKNALEIMSTAYVDVILSDINIPGMDGIQLLEEVNRQWPGAKVIFLTGYDRFDYAYKAIKDKAFSYILKTEGDAMILSTVREAFREIERERDSRKLLSTARGQKREIMKLLQKDFIFSLIEKKASTAEIAEKFDELEIDLQPELDVSVLMGRVDEWPEDSRGFDRTLSLFAIQNISKELFLETPGIKVFSLNVDHSRLLWLIQAVPGDSSAAMPLLKSKLELIQNTCKEFLDLSLSLILDSHAYSWQDLGWKLNDLWLRLDSDWGLYRGVLLIDDYNNADNEHGNSAAMSKLIKTRLESLEICIESDKKEKFDQLLSSIFQEIESNTTSNYVLFMDTYYSVALFFLSYINSSGLMKKALEAFDLSRLLKIDVHTPLQLPADYLRTLANWIFENRVVAQKITMESVIGQVNSHISANLSGDLSLLKLSDLVNLNPTYLCRLYKQTTGKNLSEYINDTKMRKAKDLLKNSDMKINQIAAATGYYTTSNFNRFFKKNTNMTPQEYRMLG